MTPGYNGGMTITIELPPELVDRLARRAAQDGQDVPELLRRLAVRESEAAGSILGEPRLPGLHRGLYQIADDFDAPLPESFWLGSEDAA